FSPLTTSVAEVEKSVQLYSMLCTLPLRLAENAVLSPLLVVTAVTVSDLRKLMAVDPSETGRTRHPRSSRPGACPTARPASALRPPGASYRPCRRQVLSIARAESHARP